MGVRRSVTTWTLEMRRPEQLRPARRVEGLAVERAWEPVPELSRFFYTAVGGDWYWTDRLGWSYADWQRWVGRDEYELWLGCWRGTPVGYLELERQPGPQIELAYFGLLPRFVGRGFGGQLLSAGVERAWAHGPSRVWVHTCSLDGPQAKRNYEARGFEVCGVETAEQELAERPPGPWPGARATTAAAR
ncbi:MAG TPA: GNAT family N-acetyltransferase [Actinomycetota bacterium]